MAYVEIPCKDPEEVIMFDPPTILFMLEANLVQLRRLECLMATYENSRTALKSLRKRYEEHERRERKRVKNRKKMERMKRLRVKKEKNKAL